MHKMEFRSSFKTWTDFNSTNVGLTKIWQEVVYRWKFCVLNLFPEVNTLPSLVAKCFEKVEI